jgi:hypothetical protein
MSITCGTDKGNAYKILVGIPEGKGPLWRPRPRWEDDIKKEVKELEYEVWTGLQVLHDKGQWRGAVPHGSELSVFTKRRRFIDQLSDNQLHKKDFAS